MKDLSAGLLAHLATSTTTLATLWRVIRFLDGASFGWIDHDRDLTIAGVVYRASEGLTPTAAHSTDTFAVDTLDVTAFLDVSTEADLNAGIWDNALVTVAEVNWASPPVAFDNNLLILRHGRLGPVTRQLGRFTAEIRGLTQALSTRIGIAYTDTCPWYHAQWNGSTFVSSVECGVNLAALGFIKTGTLTSVGTDPTLTASDSAQAQANNYFDEGYLKFTSGPNSVLGAREVRRWTDREFRFHRPWPYAMASGHAYTAVRGDDKTRGTCKGVYNNLINFLGFDPPGTNKLYENRVGF